MGEVRRGLSPTSAEPSPPLKFRFAHSRCLSPTRSMEPLPELTAQTSQAAVLLSILRER